MYEIKKVAILGASGNMGSLSGGLFAQAGITCYFFARSLDKAQSGVEQAVGQARSEVLRRYIIPKTYDEMEKVIPECDWILEALAEDLKIKNDFFTHIDALRKKGSIVSTVSSGLSIHKMAEGKSEDFQKHFMGTHFYNPPGKLIANELIFHEKVEKTTRDFVLSFTEKVLRRANIVTFDVPAFAGNRIGFQFLNEAAIYAEKFGVAKIDYLLGGHTGRALPPLATIDLVGLDVHKAIVDNVYQNTNDERHETYKLPAYMQRMLDQGFLGRKAKGKGGFFSRDENKNTLELNISNLNHQVVPSITVDWIEKMKSYLHDGAYAKAIDTLKNATGEEAEVVRHFILGYVSYAFHRIGEVTPKEDSIHGIDRVMSYGFAWLPPSGWVDFLGGPKKTLDLIEKANLPVPESLKKFPEGRICRIREITRFFKAN